LNIIFLQSSICKLERIKDVEEGKLAVDFVICVWAIAAEGFMKIEPPEARKWYIFQ